MILAAPTAAAWVDAACVHWRELLIDHANCEKKAASSALALIFAYPEDQELCAALSRLAREELRHFEQVQQLMRRLQVGFERQRPGRYAAGLRAALRQHEPARKLDLLLAGALIEARSCERFALLAPRLPQRRQLQLRDQRCSRVCTRRRRAISSCIYAWRSARAATAVSLPCSRDCGRWPRWRLS